MGRLPDFIVIGAQRAGTTSLYEYLLRHPRVQKAAEKEVHFFDLRYERGESWYRKQFPSRLRRPRGITGEASPYYLFHPAVPERIRRTVPRAKLIVLLRDPVARAWSHYRLNRSRGWEPLSFEEAVRAEPERLAGEAERLTDPAVTSFAHQEWSYVARGRYAEQLERWFVHFDRSSFLILSSEDFFSRTARVLEDVLDFLGLEHRPLGPYERLNPSRDDSSLDARVRAELVDYYRPHNRRLYELLGRDFGWPA